MTECFEVPHSVDSLPWVPPHRDVAPATPDDLRVTFRRHASAVAVVTVNAAHGPVGFTATSLASVSADPPLVSFNISLTSSSWPAVSLASHLAVHILAADQEGVARRFAAQGVDRFAAPTHWQPGPYRLPLLDGVAAWLVVRAAQHVPAGDHSIVLAEVLHTAVPTGSPAPLVHHDGEFHPLPRSRSGWRNRRG